nr:immunoglobulin heavy chain junction region [Macaca mulatta]
CAKGSSSTVYWSFDIW